MSDSDDFDLGDSDDDEKSKKQENNKSASKTKRPADNSQVTVNKKKKNSTFSSSEDDDDDNEDDVQDTPQSTKKKATKKTTESTATKGHTSHTVAKPEGINNSSKPSSSASSSSSSLASSIVTSGIGGDDITRGPNVTTESAAKKLILQYLKQQNRPYSAIQVFDNLHKRIAKPTVERCLTTLSDNDGGLKVKEYGKAKIYFVDQKTMSSNYTQTQLDELDRSIITLKGEMDEAQSEEKRCKAELNAIQNEPTDAHLDRILAELETKVAEKNHRASSITSTKLSPFALKDAIKAHNFFRNKWRTRKDAVVEIMDAISDGMEKKPKAVMANMGIETDEDANCVLPAVIPEN